MKIGHPSNCQTQEVVSDKIKKNILLKIKIKDLNQFKNEALICSSLKDIIPKSDQKPEEIESFRHMIDEEIELLKKEINENNNRIHSIKNGKQDKSKKAEIMVFLSLTVGYLT